MWLSKQVKPAAATADADMGVTTISGRRVGVVTRGEVRDLPVYGPGGYLCAEDRCVAGTRPPEAPADVGPGEVYIYGPGGNTVYLRQDGSVEIVGGDVAIRGRRVDISGELTVNGTPYGPCRC